MLTKRDHRKALEDVAEIRTLAEEVEAALERDTAHIVNLETLRKLKRIEELAKRAGGKMRPR